VVSVEDPDGNLLPNALVGVAYTSSQINFTISDGNTDFEIGDMFDIEIEEVAGNEVVPLDFTAVDGSQNAYGFMIDAYDATDADVEGVAIVRNAVIAASKLVWPSGATAGQKAAALKQLKARGILARDEA
jgi:hypothetical protein